MQIIKVINKTRFVRKTVPKNYKSLSKYSKNKSYKFNNTVSERNNV